MVSQSLLLSRWNVDPKRRLKILSDVNFRLGSLHLSRATLLNFVSTCWKGTEALQCAHHASTLSVNHVLFITGNQVSFTGGSWSILMTIFLLHMRNALMISMRVLSGGHTKLIVRMLCQLVRLRKRFWKQMYHWSSTHSWNTFTCGRRWLRRRIFLCYPVNKSFRCKMHFGMQQSMAPMWRLRLVRV
jgi:hypothetical protein